MKRFAILLAAVLAVGAGGRPGGRDRRRTTMRVLAASHGHHRDARRARRTPSRPSRATTTETGEDISGPCDEAEHADDPRCTGAGNGGSASDDNGGSPAPAIPVGAAVTTTPGIAGLERTRRRRRRSTTAQARADDSGGSGSGRAGTTETTTMTTTAPGRARATATTTADRARAGTATAPAPVGPAETTTTDPAWRSGARASFLHVSRAPHVLLVEDEESITTPLLEALAREGFETAVARTAHEALELAASLHPRPRFSSTSCCPTAPASTSAETFAAARRSRSSC